MNEPRKAPSTDSIYNVAVAAEDRKLDSYTPIRSLRYAATGLKRCFCLKTFISGSNPIVMLSSWAPAFDEDPSRVEAAKKTSRIAGRRDLPY